LKNNSPTEAGPNSQTNGNALVDAINQSFALFKLNYHNQFLKAFSSESDLIAIKRLWLDSLNQYSPQTISLAAKNIVKTSEFLPTLKTVLEHCKRISGQTIPDAHQAYREACLAPSPKDEYNWSHPIVYLAGKEVGWHFLMNNSEATAFPAFRASYKQLKERAENGEELKLPEILKLEKEPFVPASKETSSKYLHSLRSFLDT
jgi:hypothetical protein